MFILNDQEGRYEGKLYLLSDRLGNLSDMANMVISHLIMMTDVH